jgi:hypothetical protein
VVKLPLTLIKPEAGAPAAGLAAAEPAAAGLADALPLAAVTGLEAGAGLLASADAGFEAAGGGALGLGDVGA